MDRLKYKLFLHKSGKHVLSNCRELTSELLGISPQCVSRLSSGEFNTLQGWQYIKDHYLYLEVLDLKTNKTHRISKFKDLGDIGGNYYHYKKLCSGKNVRHRYHLISSPDPLSLKPRAYFTEGEKTTVY